MDWGRVDAFLEAFVSARRDLQRGPFWTLKGFGVDHYRVSGRTTIVVDLGPL